MEELIRVSKSVVGDEEKNSLCSVIDEGYLGMGEPVRQFEAELGKFFGVEEVICVNSGTAALHLGLMGLGIGPDDEVLVQSITYVASCQAITACGARPIFCEVKPDTLTIDLDDAKKKITGKTRAIMPVHYAGGVGNLDQVYNFAVDHKIRVIEDAAHAFGTYFNNRKIGSLGDVVCFSFDGIKNITSGEGGAVITQDSQVKNFVKDARLLGVQKDTEKRYKGLRSWEFSVLHQGYRYHMSNLFGAIGLAQLKKFEAFSLKRKKICKNYDYELKTIQEIETLSLDYENVTPHIYSIKVKNGLRDKLRKYLAENMIETGIHYYPNHLLDFFKKKSCCSLENTESIYYELITLPLHPGISDIDQQKIIRCVKSFFS